MLDMPIFRTAYPEKLIIALVIVMKIVLNIAAIIIVSEYIVKNTTSEHKNHFLSERLLRNLLPHTLCPGADTSQDNEVQKFYVEMKRGHRPPD